MSRRNDPFDDPFFRGIDRGPSLAAKVGFALWGLFCLAVSLAFLGVIVWAIITLVQWAVTK